MDSFPLLGTLNINTIRILKHFTNKMYNPVLVRREQEMEGIYMILNGKFQLYDDNNVLINEV